MRINEAVTLPVTAIDSKQMVLRVIGKRNKERALPLTESILDMLEQGVDIRIIQMLLGHSSIRSTEIYTHLSTPLQDDLRQLLRRTTDGLLHRSTGRAVVSVRRLRAVVLAFSLLPQPGLSEVSWETDPAVAPTA